MTDLSDIPVPGVMESLSNDMLYGLKPTAPKSRAYRSSIPSLSSSSFQASSTMIFEIPTGGHNRNIFIDPTQTYLKGGLQAVSTAASTNSVYTDDSAYSLLNTFTLYNARNTLEQMNNYGEMCNHIINNTMTRAAKAGLSCMILCNPLTNVNTTLTSVAALPFNYNNNSNAATGTSLVFQEAGDKSGLALTTATTFAGAPIYSFALPLCSGIIGSNASKMFPISQLTAPL
jgi:hypothetical protein